MAETNDYDEPLIDVNETGDGVPTDDMADIDGDDHIGIMSPTELLEYRRQQCLNMYGNSVAVRGVENQFSEEEFRESFEEILSNLGLPVRYDGDTIYFSERGARNFLRYHVPPDGV